MGHSVGAKLGPYEILSPLGAGGMGEVYRARDTKLNRDVALKVLPDAFAQDAERMARFQREAQVLASLNHPNIAAIYGLEESDGLRALVMELVEGQTLAEIVGARRAVPLPEALPIAKQIADALEYAHERGIIHRDLKPANIKITPEGTAKILDFGLAKALDVGAGLDPAQSGRPQGSPLQDSPTLTAAATQAGVILGTAAYMPPEQARGKTVDRRADIWAFGCVLYEMLAGNRLFDGDTVSDTLAAVLTKEPDWDALPADTPPKVQELIRRCQTKDSKQRLQAIGEARIAIEEELSGTGVPTVADHGPEAHATTEEGARRAPLRALPWAVAGALAVALIGVTYLWKFSTHAPQSPMRFSAITNFSGVQAQPAISPDGRSVAFVSNRDGNFNIYVTLVHGGSLVQITHDPNLESSPAWSPDGADLAYARLNDSGLWDVWEIAALGGTPQRVMLNGRNPDWSPDGRSLAYENTTNSEIWISSISGENAHRAVPLQAPWSRNRMPSFSPDGSELAFVMNSNGPYGELEVENLASGKMRQLTHDNSQVLSPAWSADGRSIYFASSRGGTLNIWKIAATGGEPEQITVGEGDDVDLDVSKDGKRVIFGTLREKTGIARLDLQAKPGEQSVKVLTTDPARDQWGPVYSPDGKHLAYHTNFKAVEREQIWVSDADGENAAPLVKDSRINVLPRWMPDGKSIIYMSFAGHGYEYRRVSLAGGAPQTLPTKPNLDLQDVGQDGRLLFKDPKDQIEAFSPHDDKTQTLGTLPAGGGFPRWSPDGKSVAYVVKPNKADDPIGGLWVDDFKNPPRQIFRGWVWSFARGPGNEIYLLEGKPDLNTVLWKVNWDGQGLVRTQWSVPMIFGVAWVPFDISPDGRYLAFDTDQVLNENIGMIENVR